MIDLHSHVLPCVDDGSDSLEETLEMLQQAVCQGVRYMVATPHFYADRMTPCDFLQRRQQAFDRVVQETTAPAIVLGAEVYYFDNMSRSQELQKLQIGSTGLLLVEMPFSGWTDRVVEDVCRLQDRQGLTPILAHVERYRGNDQFPRYRDMLLSEGVLMQANAGAFRRLRTGYWLLRQMKAGRIHFLGSDCHNLTSRQPNMETAARVIEKRLGREALQDMMDFSAQALGL